MKNQSQIVIALNLIEQGIHIFDNTQQNIEL